MNVMGYALPFGPRTLSLMLGLIVLIGFGFSGLLVSREQVHEKRMGQRRDSVLRRHVHLQPIDMRLFTRAAEAETTFKSHAASWFGIDLERPDICPLPWWVVVAGAAVAVVPVIWATSSLVGPLAWLSFPVLWIIASRFGFEWFRGKRRAELMVQFPDALMMIVRAVRVGVPVTEAIHIIAMEQPQPTAGEFALLANQLSIGEPLDKAIRSMARHADMSEYRFFATALTLQSKAGAALSGTLENLAEMIRKRVAVKQRAHALASEARMSIYVLTGLPMLVGAALTVIRPTYISVLLTDPIGNKILISAALSLSMGWGTMQFIVKKSVS